MTNYWIKLYHEILNDPKMCRLSDHLYRRVIELFLVAGQSGEDGTLPSVEDIAWTLRAEPEAILVDLEQLEATGIVTLENGRWVVTNFSKRQSAATGQERAKRHREKERNVQYYGNEVRNEVRNEVVTSRYVDTDTDTDTDKNDEEEEEVKNPEFRPAIFALYQKEIGPLTPMIADALKAAEKDYPPDWVALAFSEAATRNARSWAYVEAILKRWRKDGFKADSRIPKNGKSPGQKLSAAAQAAAALRLRYGVTDDTDTSDIIPF